MLSSRSDPPLPLARWQAQGHLNELRGTDLRFTLEETEAFLTRVLGSEAAHEIAGALEERTEGWIAVLRLAALSLRNASDQTAFLERLGHSPDRYGQQLPGGGSPQPASACRAGVARTDVDIGAVLRRVVWSGHGE